MRRPLYLQFSGHCNKWKAFDKSLLQFPVFKQALQKMSKAVSYDIAQLITNPTNIMADPVDFFVAIVASQVSFIETNNIISLRCLSRLIGNGSITTSPFLPFNV